MTTHALLPALAAEHARRAARAGVVSWANVASDVAVGHDLMRARTEEADE